MRIGRWSDPRFVFIRQLVEVIREDDDNETSGQDGLALPGSLIGESHLRIPKLKPDIIFSNRVPLESVKFESSGGPGKEGNLLHKSLLVVCRRC